MADLLPAAYSEGLKLIPEEILDLLRQSLADDQTGPFATQAITLEAIENESTIRELIERIGRPITCKDVIRNRVGIREFNLARYLRDIFSVIDLRLLPRSLPDKTIENIIRIAEIHDRFPNLIIEI